MRVLVVEDEHRIATAIKKGLEQERYAVDVAYTGTDGLDMALGESYDAIILDRMLPGMDAEELPFQFEESYPSDMEAGETEALLTDLPITNGFVIDQVAAEPAPTVVDIPKGEPTVEEYKRRLNELLAGGK